MRGILLDIEGTTTPISFVYEVLFPFARARAREHLRTENLNPLKQEYDEDVRQGQNPPPWSDEPIEYVHWLMDQDRKSTALKALQGKIWLDGYNHGELRGEVFPDVPPALKRWRDEHLDVRIFSSGSELAQRLLFSTTRFGDLTAQLNGFFDTTIGAKTARESYERIASAFQCEAPDIVFISDVTIELDAAEGAGMQTLLCIRPGNRPQPPHHHSVISDFVDLRR